MRAPSAPVESYPMPVGEVVAPPSREQLFRQLLPYDYEYAAKEGLFDLFYYDPETGEDGLLHTLAGNVISDPTGFRVEGFHHEPSGAVVWPQVIGPDGTPMPVTRVDRSGYHALDAKSRRELREYPFEPHLGPVVINGIVKYSLLTHPATGEKVITPAKNSMFPREYDALAVMQAVRIALVNRDPQKDKFTENSRGEQIIVNDSWAPLIDGKTPMKVRLVLDATTGKVRTAIPIVKDGGGQMKLTPQDIDRIVYGK